MNEILYLFLSFLSEFDSDCGKSLYFDFVALINWPADCKCNQWTLNRKTKIWSFRVTADISLRRVRSFKFVSVSVFLDLQTIWVFRILWMGIVTMSKIGFTHVNFVVHNIFGFCVHYSWFIWKWMHLYVILLCFYNVVCLCAVYSSKLYDLGRVFILFHFPIVSNGQPKTCHLHRDHDSLCNWVFVHLILLMNLIGLAIVTSDLHYISFIGLTKTKCRFTLLLSLLTRFDFESRNKQRKSVFFFIDHQSSSIQSIFFAIFSDLSFSVCLNDQERK